MSPIASVELKVNKNKLNNICNFLVLQLEPDREQDNVDHAWVPLTPRKSILGNWQSYENIIFSIFTFINLVIIFKKMIWRIEAMPNPNNAGSAQAKIEHFIGVKWFDLYLKNIYIANLYWEFWWCIKIVINNECISKQWVMACFCDIHAKRIFWDPIAKFLSIAV